MQSIESGGVNLMRGNNEPEIHQEVKNKQINDLTDMVRTLLEEQRLLKEKLELQETKYRDGTTGNADGGGNGGFL